MWCRNNLKTVGKWGRIIFVFGVVLVAFVFQINLTPNTYASETIPTSSYQQKEFKIDFNHVLDGLRLNQKINIGTGTPLTPIKSSFNNNIDFGKFFGSSSVSSNDVVSFLKEAATTVINLSILVISITTQILKGLLGAIK